MQTTLEEVKSHRPCKDGWKLLTKTLGRTTGPVTLKEIYESNGYTDAVWCLRCFPFESYRPWLVEVVEAVLPAFERVFPEDKRLRQAIEAIKNEASEAELKAAADVARSVSYAAFAARTADVARSVSYAAFAASRAARTAADAARTAPYPVSAIVFASFAAFDAARVISLETIEPIFIKHFCN